MMFESEGEESETEGWDSTENACSKSEDDNLVVSRGTARRLQRARILFGAALIIEF